MREIQNCSLLTKERKKRVWALRKEKRKELFEKEERIVNISLLDFDISNKERVILREAKNAWELGKKLGLSIRGDEKDVIDEILSVEV